MKNTLKAYVSQKEILRYLHHKGQPISDEMMDLISTTLEETMEISNPKFSLKRLPINLSMTDIEVLSESSDVLYHISSRDLCEVMQNSNFFIFGATTLGFGIVRRINALMLTSPTRAIIMDACASVLIDAFCDYIEDNIKQLSDMEDDEDERFISQRFSPGYGDLKLEVQKNIADLMRVEKTLGVHVTEHFQLQPEKSVFFIMGVSSSPYDVKVKTCGNNCSECLLKNCLYREA